MLLCLIVSIRLWINCLILLLCCKGLIGVVDLVEVFVEFGLIIVFRLVFVVKSGSSEISLKVRIMNDVCVKLICCSVGVNNLWLVNLR